MAYDISLSECKTKGGITLQGNSSRANRENCWDVTHLSFGTAFPKNLATRRASGEKQHKAARFVIPVDHATPLWFQVGTNQDTIEQLRFAMHTISDDGQHVEKFIVTMHEVQISDFHVQTGTGGDNDDDTTRTRNVDQTEETLALAVVYTAITLENVHGQATMAQDSWTGNYA